MGGVKRLKSRLIAWLAILLAALLPCGASAFGQNVSFQTVPQAISVVSSTNAQKFALNVISQTAHVLTYSWAGLSGPTLCEVYLDGSQSGNAPWYVLAVGLYE